MLAKKIAYLRSGHRATLTFMFFCPPALFRSRFSPQLAANFVCRPAGAGQVVYSRPELVKQLSALLKTRLIRAVRLNHMQ